MAITGFTQMEVWQCAHQEVLRVYRLTRTFPRDERFGLIAQMRTAATSIPANIAEGFGRRKPVDKSRFYNLSQGSTEELRYYYILAKDLGYLADNADGLAALDSISRMLRRLVQSTLGEPPASPRDLG